MTSTLAHIPLAVGAGVFDAAMRAGRWGISYFLRAPMASSGLVLITGLTLSAAANALYLQDTHHPAPLFGGGGVSSTPQGTSHPIAPVVVEPEAIPQRPTESANAPAQIQDAGDEPANGGTISVAETSADAAAPMQSIGNQEIADLQRKLSELGMFDGVVDGYYGPKTADAIRAFEAKAGLPRTGAATPQVMEAVERAPLPEAAVQVPETASETDPVTAASVEPEDDSAASLIAQMQQESAPPATVAAETVERVAEVSAEAPVAPRPSTTAPTTIPPALDDELVREIQRGLSRLGFLQGPVNGVADEATARAIRKFQIFNNFSPTGEVSPTVRQMLVSAGAYL